MRVDVDPATSQLEFRWAARYGRPQLPVRVLWGCYLIVVDGARRFPRVGSCFSRPTTTDG